MVDYAILNKGRLICDTRKWYKSFSGFLLSQLSLRIKLSRLGSGIQGMRILENGLGVLGQLKGLLRF